MSVAHATALLPAGARLALRDYAPVEDAAALAALARWAVRFSPTVAPDYPDGLVLDVTGCQRLYGSDENLAALVAEALRSLGLEARVGVASTIGAAWAVSRFATANDTATHHLPPSPLRPVAANFASVSIPVERRHGGRLKASVTGWRVVNEDEWPVLFGRLPIAALRVEERVVDELAEVGIDHVGQLLEIPREEIAARFDVELLLRIDQATGEAMEALRPVRHEEPPRVTLRFAGPTTQFEAIQQAVQKLVEMLCARLLKREAGARRLMLEVERLDEELHPEWAQEILTLSRPSRSARHIWNLLRPRIERLHLGEGVEELSLCGQRTAPLPHEQEHFDGSSDESEEATSARLKEAAGQLVDLLESRLGPPAVLAAKVVETHIPEATFRMLPASEGGLRFEKPQRSQRAEGAKQIRSFSPRPLRLTGSLENCVEEILVDEADSIGTKTLEATSTSIPPPGDRPTVLLAEPESAAVTMLQPEGPIIGLQWRRLHRIRRAIGPERIGRRWWQFPLSRRRPARDYYRLEDEEGLWLWVYRSRFSRKWFVQGIWG